MSRLWGRAKYWSEDRMVAAVQTWVQEHDGRWPEQDDFTHDSTLPHAVTVTRALGSLAALRRLAGHPTGGFAGRGGGGRGGGRSLANRAAEPPRPPPLRPELLTPQAAVRRVFDAFPARCEATHLVEGLRQVCLLVGSLRAVAEALGLTPSVLSESLNHGRVPERALGLLGYEVIYQKRYAALHGDE